MSLALFWLSGVAALLSALGVVFSRQALQSVLWMFALLISLSGVMIALGAYLLALVTVLVYAGAILVLFTFVVMFVGQQNGRKKIGRWRLGWAVAALVATLFAAWPVLCGAGHGQGAEAINSLTRTSLYGPELFARYQLPTQIAGWLLLWVAVGAFNIMSREGVRKV